MNQGGKFGPVKGLGYDLCIGEFTYFPNGTSDPVLASVTGTLARWITSITYSATGVQTIVFAQGFNFANAPRFDPAVTAAALASSFTVVVIGQFNRTTRTLVLQQAQNVTGYAAAASADCSVSVTVLASDTTGK